jgi:hypothetical protein
MTLRKTILFALTLALATTLVLPGAAFAKTKITIKNADGPGEGFNDPTPKAPIGGNTGTTLGQQRLNSFQAAADIWSELVDSDVEIIIRANFDPLTCDDTGATLGAAGASFFVNNFPNAPKANVWYNVALASKLAKSDLANGQESIRARFNSSIDNRCFNGEVWYYGLDGNHGSDEDLLVTLLHEFGHGLGFSGATNSETGEFAQNKPHIWDFYTIDTATGLLWKDETAAQRVTSVISGKLAWNGTLAVNASKTYLKDVATLPPVPQLFVGSSNPVKFNLGTAGFGPTLTAAGLTGQLLGATNAATAPATSTTDGCAAFTNAAQMVGKIAVVDRGNCNFTVKAKNAQLAGAVATVVIGRPEDCAVFGLGGTDSTVTIPAVSVTAQDGAAIRALMAQSTQTGTFGVFLRGGNLAGADTVGNVLLFSPCNFIAGSSVYHFDTSATPNLLMEPNINSDLQHKVDLTLDQLKELGWTSSASTTNPGTGDPVKTTGRKNIKKHH